MDKDTVNQDRNLIGRIGALAVIVVAVVGLGRVCGMHASCPISGGRFCPFTSSTPSK
jgi:flavin reductase (DIM6/NTAB) family NADH-FMN oxidoreductase RutF